MNRSKVFDDFMELEYLLKFYGSFEGMVWTISSSICASLRIEFLYLLYVLFCHQGYNFLIFIGCI